MEKRYSSLEGIRGWACILIVMAHIYLNAVYQLGNSYRKVMLFAVEMVFLYMVISGFSICCGYCTPLTNGTVTVSQFYQKRYQKIWPFWAVLVLAEVIVSPGKETFFEAFADLSLLFGLLPNASISVIGVGWFLGVVFVFYLVFPFICFLIQTKKRAWCTFGGAAVYHLLCIWYFFDRNHMPEGYYMRTNFLYCMIFFLAGCILYLYRNYISEFVQKHKFMCWLLAVTVTIIYFYKNLFLSEEYTPIWVLLISASYVIYAMGTSGFLLNNRLIKFISKLSMEIYLAHMLTFRIFEKLDLLYVFGNETFVRSVLSYSFTVFVVIAGTVCFALSVRKVLLRVAIFVKQLRKRVHLAH